MSGKSGRNGFSAVGSLFLDSLLDNSPHNPGFGCYFCLPSLATNFSLYYHENMKGISTQSLRKHVYELTGKIGEHNVFHADTLHAAEPYISAQ
jgi:hypothetical protein